MSESNSSDPQPNPVPFAGPADFAALLRRMQPRGRIWDGPDGGIMAQLRVGQTALMAQFSGRLAALTETESYPPTSVELLPAWNGAFGLPDPCMPLNPTVEQQQKALAARLAQTGGLSRASIIAIAAALGYTITIAEFKTRRFGQTFEDSYFDLTWQFAWIVSAPELTISYKRFGISTFEEPYATWDNTTLQCVLNRFAPPHTTVFFSYTS